MEEYTPIILKQLTKELLYNEQCKCFQLQFDNQASIRIHFLTDDIVRIKIHFIDKNNHKNEEQSYAIVMTGWPDRFDQLLKNYRIRIQPLQKDSIKIKKQELFYQLQTKQIRLKIYKKPFGFEINDLNDVILHSDLRGKAYMRDHKLRSYHYIQHNQNNDCYYGFGQNTGKFNKKHQRIYQSPKDALGYDAESTSPLYKHIPFYIKLNKQTNKATGYFYDNSYESYFDMGRERSGYWPRYSYFSTEGGDIDLYFINGPTIKEVVKRYTDLTGKTALCPMEGLGYLGSTMYYVELRENCDEGIINFVKMCHKHEIPISNFHLSSGYTINQKHNKRYVFTWNQNKFKDPNQFFAQMLKLGVSVSPNIKPGMLQSHPLYEQFSNNQAFIKNTDKSTDYIDQWWGGQGSFVDFTSPKGRSQWSKYLKKQIIQRGTFTIWNDNNQYEQLSNKLAYCDFEGKGSTIQRMKPLQSLMMSHVAAQALNQVDSNHRPYIITRSGYAGIQRYASTWSGDNYTSWKTLKYNISTVLNMGLSGVANYGCDIGGFWGPAPTEQLFIRWVQHGIFQPRFSIHSCNSDNTVSEPWMFQNSTHLISRAIKLRYSMMPYLYSLLFLAHTTGEPIMRPLIYQFQNDIKCYSEGQNFMVGPYLLIANIIQPLEKSQQKTVYLPEGYDWHQLTSTSYKIYKGGKDITFPIDIQSIPMFIKQGAIISFTDNFTDINRKHINNIRLLVAPLRYSKKLKNCQKISEQFTLYEDDGKTNDYKKQIYLKTKIRTETYDNWIQIIFDKKGKYETKIENWNIKLISLPKCPCSIFYSEHPDLQQRKQIPHYLHKQKWQDNPFGFYYNHTLKTTEIKYKNNGNKSFKIFISLAALIQFKKQYKDLKNTQLQK